MPAVLARRPTWWPGPPGQLDRCHRAGRPTRWVWKSWCLPTCATSMLRRWPGQRRGDAATLPRGPRGPECPRRWGEAPARARAVAVDADDLVDLAPAPGRAWRADRAGWRLRCGDGGDRAAGARG